MPTIAVNDIKPLPAPPPPIVASQETTMAVPAAVPSTALTDQGDRAPVPAIQQSNFAAAVPARPRRLRSRRRLCRPRRQQQQLHCPPQHKMPLSRWQQQCQHRHSHRLSLQLSVINESGNREQYRHGWQDCKNGRQISKCWMTAPATSWTRLPQ